MSKLLSVAQEELSYHLSQWTFYLSVVMMVLVFAGVGALPRLPGMVRASPLASVETVFTISETLVTPTGYVDEAELIKEVPEAANWRAFDDKTAAAAALARGDIESYYVIAADYMESGAVTHYSPNPQLLAGSDDAVKKLLRDNLLRTLDPPHLAERLETPLNLSYNGPPPPVLSFLPADVDFKGLFSAGLVVALFALIINVGGTLLLRALQREVRTRVLELLVASTTPGQFIGGKLLALVTLALGQAGLSLLAGLVVYGGQAAGSLGPNGLPLPALALSLPYLLLGYLAYCGAMMGVAALWPNLPESNLLLMVVRMLAFAPVLGVIFILVDADGLPAVGLTLLPLTSPLLMPFRLLLGHVPPWQWGLGGLILALWAALSIWVCLRLFRTHTLLTGRPPTFRTVLLALRQN